MVRISELRIKDIINVVDGRRLGPVKDIEIDLENGRIRGIILQGPVRLMSFLSRQDDMYIPWEKIVRFGVDVVLVELPGFTDNRSPREDRGW